MVIVDNMPITNIAKHNLIIMVIVEYKPITNFAKHNLIIMAIVLYVLLINSPFAKADVQVKNYHNPF